MLAVGFLLVIQLKIRLLKSMKNKQILLDKFIMTIHDGEMR